jgi:phosphatidylglycerophosphate synthase
MKWLPNALSYSRAVLGALVIPVLVWFGLWDWAFWTMVFAAFTDFADGGAAILLRCGTKWGKEVLDPRCDALLEFGIIVGWVIEANHFTRFWWFVLMYLVGEGLYRIKHGSRSSVQRIATIGLPVCYFVTLYAFGYHYAHNAYGDAMQRPWWMASLLIIPAVLAKIPRFRAWTKGQL